MSDLQATLPDGSRWRLAAEPIAQSYALYYAQADAGPADEIDAEQYPNYKTELEASYREHLEQALADPAALIDWVQNNMDWEEIAHFAQRLPPEPVDLAELWLEAELSVLRS